MPNNNNESFGNSTGVWAGKNTEKKAPKSNSGGNPASFEAPPVKVKTTNTSVKGEPNWEEVTFNNHPKVKYWHKKSTGERQWWGPNENASNDPSEKVNNKNVPSGWTKKKHRNNNSNKPLYWYEKNNSGNTVWSINDIPKNEAKKANNAVNNAVKNVNKAANAVNNAGSSPAVNNALKPVKNQLEIVQQRLNEVKSVLGKANNTAAAAGGGRRKTRNARKSRRKTRGRRRN